jgi:hypothetical protein
MTKYFIIVCNGFQSSHYFRTEQEAQAAADRRNALVGGTHWTIRPIWSSDKYADDRRPYGIVKRA